MIDLPLDKALVAVEVSDGVLWNSIKRCEGCYFYTAQGGRSCWYHTDKIFVCRDKDRKDGKNVIFKLEDYPAKEDKEP